MSDRERWIVYPLLFFSLVMGLRLTYVNPYEFRCRTIECQSLQVEDNLQVGRINGSRSLADPRVARAGYAIVVPAGTTGPAPRPPHPGATTGASNADPGPAATPTAGSPKAGSPEPTPPTEKSRPTPASDETEPPPAAADSPPTEPT